MQDLYLIHHGVEGQHWGKRNGPPYPLDAEGKAELRAQKKAEREAEREERKVDKLAKKYKHKITKSVRRYSGETKDIARKRLLDKYYKKIKDLEVKNETRRRSGRPVMISPPGYDSFGTITGSTGAMYRPAVYVSAEEYYKMQAKALERERKALDKIRDMKI